MEKITGERCIELMKENFSNFSAYWEEYLRNVGSDLGLTIQMMPFEEYAIDIIKSNDEVEIKKFSISLNFCSVMVMILFKPL